MSIKSIKHMRSRSKSRTRHKTQKGSGNGSINRAAQKAAQKAKNIEWKARKNLIKKIRSGTTNISVPSEKLLSPENSSYVLRSDAQAHILSKFPPNVLVPVQEAQKNPNKFYPSQVATSAPSTSVSTMRLNPPIYNPQSSLGKPLRQVFSRISNRYARSKKTGILTNNTLKNITNKLKAFSAVKNITPETTSLPEETYKQLKQNINNNKLANYMMNLTKVATYYEAQGSRWQRFINPKKVEKKAWVQAATNIGLKYVPEHYSQAQLAKAAVFQQKLRTNYKVTATLANIFDALRKIESNNPNIGIISGNDQTSLYETLKSDLQSEEKLINLGERNNAPANHLSDSSYETNV